MTNQPTITMITDSLSPLAGGMYFSARLPANLMAARGRSPVVIGLDDERHAETRDSWKVERLTAVERRGPGGFLSSRTMTARLNDARPDLVHLRGIWGPYGVAAERWHRRTGKPLLISPHGMLDPYALTISALKKKVARLGYADRLLRNATAVHALNRSEADAVRQFGLANPLAIIPNGVDVFPESQREAGAKKRMAFLSRIHPKKGIAELLLGWRRALDEQPQALSDWELTLAGWGADSHIGALEKLVQELGISDTVSFMGPLFDEAKRAYLDSADAFILPSFSEGLPVSVLEAWERSLPVLMTDRCNLPEGFRAGAAMRIEPEPSNIAAQLSHFCAFPPEARRIMGQKGRAMVRERYDWERITDQYLELYDWLTTGGEVPRFVELAD